MRRASILVVVLAGCAASYGSSGVDGGSDSDAGQAFTSDAGSFDAGVAIDGTALNSGDSGSTDAGAESAIDSGVDSGSNIPFASYLVLRLETDAPNGLQTSGAWRDLSPHSQAITIASGTSTVQTTGDAGAKSMVFGASGPYFDVADAPSLQFGTTDDFMIVVRATQNAVATAPDSCSFHYMFAKYASDGETGVHIRVCTETSSPTTLAGSLKLTVDDATITPPASLANTFGVVSFARNMSGAQIEIYAAGTSTTTAVTSPVDVSAIGSAFVLGGARSAGTGSPFGSYAGNINRLYIFHAPPGTLSTADLATIRSYVSTAAPLP